MSDLLDKCAFAVRQAEYEDYVRFCKADGKSPTDFPHWDSVVNSGADQIEQAKRVALAVARVLLKEPANEQMCLAACNAELERSEMDRTTAESYAAMAAALLSDLEGEAPATDSADSGSTTPAGGATHG